MLYIFAIFLPPLTPLFAGRPFSFLLNLFFYIAGLALTLFFGLGLILIIFCMIHSCAVASDHYRDERESDIDRIVEAVRGEYED